MEIAELAVLVGQVQGGINALQTAQADQSKNISKIFDRLEKLPCGAHDDDIGDLQDWRKSCNGIKKEEHIEAIKGDISLRNTVIAALLTFFFGIIGTVITLVMTGIIE